MKIKYDIFHVYHGTQGTAGLYMDEIYQSLKDKYNQKVFVSYFYPFDYGDKIFYKRSTINKGIKHDLLRKIIKYFELYFGLIKILWQIFLYRPKLINFSLISLYLPERLFLSLVHFLFKSKILITCHDVIPFTSKIGFFDNEMRNRKRYFDIADFLIVHNQNSADELSDIYKIEKEKILFHPFPVMDLQRMDFKLEKNKLYDFAFIGVLRKAKGIHVLLGAWEKFISEFPDSKLLVAGKLAGESIDVQIYSSKNVVFNLEYLDDYEYCSIINSAKCVVLPYLRGTNSGIPSSVLSLGTDIIVSDTPMFKNNEIIPNDSFFKTEDSVSLYSIMKNKYTNGFINEDKSYILKYRENFVQQVSEVYKKCINT